VTLLTEYGKYQTNTIYLSKIPGQLALIIINTTLLTKRIYSPLKRFKVLCIPCKVLYKCSALLTLLT